VPQVSAESFAKSITATREDPSKTFVLLINFTPADRKVWEEPRVKDWLAAHTGSLSTGAYGPRDSWDQSSRLEPAPPFSPGSVTAYRKGVLLDWDAKLASADDVLEWLSLVEKGDVPLAYARKRAGERDLRNSEPRVIMAERLARAGRLDESDAEYEWWFERYIRDTLEGVKPNEYSRYPGEVCAERAKALAARDPAVKARLIGLRDQLRLKAEAAPGENMSRFMWLSMCRDFPDSDNVVKWFTAYEEPKEKPRFGNVEHSTWYRVVEVLVADNRWADAGKFVRRPLATVGEAGMGLRFAALKRADEGVHGGTHASTGYKDERQYADEFIGLSSTLYAALLAAAREDDARRVAETAFEHLGLTGEAWRAKAALVKMALKAVQARPVHKDWAAEADAQPDVKDKLLPRVEAMLEGRK
jgi:hypothetical protein